MIQTEYSHENKPETPNQVEDNNCKKYTFTSYEVIHFWHRKGSNLLSWFSAMESPFIRLQGSLASKIPQPKSF